MYKINLEFNSRNLIRVLDKLKYLYKIVYFFEFSQDMFNINNQIFKRRYK